MTVAAYALSAIAGALHFQHAITHRFAPSHWALHVLTVGFIGLLGALLVYTRRQPATMAGTRWKGAGWALALAVFAVSALHLSHHEGQDYSWWIELIGHHASLPLVLAILYQDYRFALADIFLKRALALLLLVALACGLYLLIAAPLLAQRGTHGSGAALAVLGLWVATALVYPMLRRLVERFVDAIVLRRADYEVVRVEIAQTLAAQDAPADVLTEVCRCLSTALTARQVNWTPLADDETLGQDSSPSGPLLPLIEQHKNARRLPKLREATADTSSAPRASASALVPTTEAPQYRLLIGELAGGRRLLSDDLALIEAAAVLAARRIDQVRVLHERCVRDLHEQEITKLATEAELRALRAQINPHFLFNALTTIGYLIQAAPDRALATLLRLTSLLRGVLRQSSDEFSTLGDEIELIEAYLDIERARFEERLRVVIDVPDYLRSIRIPALLLQPLVENAIKHGIAPQRAGGEVVIQAHLVGTNAADVDAVTLRITVRDTGAGIDQRVLEHWPRRGVGLTNVEQRIHRHYGSAGNFAIRSAPGAGTTVALELPSNPPRQTTTEVAATRAAVIARRRSA
jgi:two-component system, LytTR family, sensor kinase